MRQTVLIDGVAKSLDDMVLSKDVSKSAGAIFPCKNLITHRGDNSDDSGFVSVEF